MTIKQYRFAVSEVENYDEIDAYVSGLALSSEWGDEEAADIPAERIEALRQIWTACHRSVKEIAADAGLSCRKLAARFCVPCRTMEDWSAGKSACPIYTRLMMQECLGLLKL